ncbi:thermonuclease family protein [Oryzifoliimicrobium ureilyticus]|uniref:thermonuclease family protein n=1 Tax=Oryzifoliimicrobium ureilyticus TaxID=3113724 RepID=UPI003075FCE1
MLTILLSLAQLQTAFAQEPIIGRSSVIDGDTIDISGTRIRIWGIDAPESWQRCLDAKGNPYQCGKNAADALDQFLAASRPTRCEQVDVDRYHRIVARCSRSDGASVNAWLVETGNAIDWPRYSHGAYSTMQEKAKGRRSGIWQGTFVKPCIARAKLAGRIASC